MLGGKEKMEAKKKEKKELGVVKAEEPGMAGFASPGDNVIYIGNKSVMSYVLAVVTAFNRGSDEVVIEARGRAISRAVDTVEVVKNKFQPNLETKDIKIGTESIVREDGSKKNVSSLEITLGPGPLGR
jgi:DNA-binding protein